jgi:ribonuclease G
MKKEWFFDRYCGRQFVALLEDGKLAEFAAEIEKSGEVVGNIYKGRVTNILPGMQAAFVSCGLEKNCYLSTDETYADYTKYDGVLRDTPPRHMEWKIGDEVIVQVTKPPRGNKGAKVTTRLSFVGKNLIYLPNTDFMGISRKIVEEELRQSLLLTAESLREKPDEGFIIRTGAPLATLKQLKREAEYLKNLSRVTLESAKDAPVGAVLYRDFDLPVRVMRDSMGDDVTAMHVGDIDLFNRLLKLVRLRGDLPEKKLVLFNGKRAMFREYGISPLISAVVRPTVPLDGGGYLVIDPTEAMTVVDVNTGSYIGSTNLEDTVFNVNLEAAREIARQVRLRNIGGIVVVDFIDMLDEEHKTAVTAELEACLAKDKAKCNVLPMSEFCLTQFTRKRVGAEIQSYLVRPCNHCRGRGYFPEEIFVITGIRADILDCFADGYRAVVIELQESVMKHILVDGMFSNEVKTVWRDKQIYLIPHKTYREDEYSVRGDNSSVLHLPDKAQILY